MTWAGTEVTICARLVMIWVRREDAAANPASMILAIVTAFADILGISVPFAALVRFCATFHTVSAWKSRMLMLFELPHWSFTRRRFRSQKLVIGVSRFPMVVAH